MIVGAVAPFPLSCEGWWYQLALDSPHICTPIGFPSPQMASWGYLRGAWFHHTFHDLGKSLSLKDTASKPGALACSSWDGCHLPKAYSTPYSRWQYLHQTNRENHGPPFQQSFENVPCIETKPIYCKIVEDTHIIIGIILLFVGGNDGCRVAEWRWCCPLLNFVCWKGSLQQFYGTLYLIFLWM